MLAKRSPSIKTSSVGGTGRALQFRGYGRCCSQQQLLMAGTLQAALKQLSALASWGWGSHKSFIKDVRRQHQQPRECLCKWRERWVAVLVV
jgi:hypothetical protein